MDKNKENIEKWVNNLSSEIAEKLSIVLSSAIPVIEIYNSSKGSSSSIPLSAFEFSKSGVSDDVASVLLKSFGVQAVTLIRGVCMLVPIDTFELLKYAQGIVTNRLASERAEQQEAQKENDTKGKMNFDSQNGILRYQDIKPYSFHR